MIPAGGPPRRPAMPPAPGGGADLADILERVLDKGIVIAGDIRVNLLDIELLTIKIRLIVASVDRAREMGIDWWEHDPALSSGRHGVAAMHQAATIPPIPPQQQPAEVISGPVLDGPAVAVSDG